MLSQSGDVVVAQAPANGEKVSLTGFLVVAFALSWIGATPMVLASWFDAQNHGDTHAWLVRLAPLQVLMFLGPLIAAIWASWRNYGRDGPIALLRALVRFRLSPLFYLAVLAGPGLVAISSLLLAEKLDSSIDSSISRPMFLAAAQVFAVYLVLNTEEIAWRGYALPQLQRELAPIAANLRLSAIWGVFHMPLFLMQGGHPAGYSIFVFVLLVLALGMLNGYLFNASGGSVLIVHLFHQSMNGWWEGMGLFPVMHDGAGLPFTIAVAFAAIFGGICAFKLRRMRAASQA